MQRGVAEQHERRDVLPRGEPPLLLRAAARPHLAVLRPHLDQGVAAVHPVRLQGRADGADAAKVQSQGGEDAGRGGHPVRVVVAAALHHLRARQAGRRPISLGGGGGGHGDARGAVARGVQLVHQPHPVRLLQQQVPARLPGHPAVAALLRPPALLRDGGHGRLVVGVHAQEFVLRDQRVVDASRAAAGRGARAGGRGARPRVGRVVHLQQQRVHRRVQHGRVVGARRTATDPWQNPFVIVVCLASCANCRPTRRASPVWGHCHRASPSSCMSFTDVLARTARRGAAHWAAGRAGHAGLPGPRAEHAVLSTC